MLYEVIIQNSLAILLICGIPRVLLNMSNAIRKQTNQKTTMVCGTAVALR